MELIDSVDLQLQISDFSSLASFFYKVTLFSIFFFNLPHRCSEQMNVSVPPRLCDVTSIVDSFLLKRQKLKLDSLI